jgi:predicted DNA-binding protein
MSSTVSRSVAARIPMESYFDLKVLSDYYSLSTSDHLNKILHDYLVNNADLILTVKSIKEKPDLKASIDIMKKILGKT